MVVYLITNLINNKMYVGQTTRSLKERWREHLSYSLINECYLHHAINQYGKENFKIEEVCSVTSQESGWRRGFTKRKPVWNKGLKMKREVL